MDPDQGTGQGRHGRNAAARSAILKPWPGHARPKVATGATAVLGTRLAMQDYHVAAAALLAVSGAGWALLLLPVLRHWKTPTASGA